MTKHGRSIIIIIIDCIYFKSDLNQRMHATILTTHIFNEFDKFIAFGGNRKMTPQHMNIIRYLSLFIHFIKKHLEYFCLLISMRHLFVYQSIAFAFYIKRYWR